MFKITGKLIEIFAEQIVSEKFRKREFVVEVEDGNFSQKLKMEFIQGNCAYLDEFCSDDLVEISFSLKGRDWTNNETGKKQYFNTIQAFGIRKSTGQPGSLPNYTKNHVGNMGNIEGNFLEDAINDMAPDDDDLPF